MSTTSEQISKEMSILSGSILLLAVAVVAVAVTVYALWPAFGWRFKPHPSEPPVK